MKFEKKLIHKKHFNFITSLHRHPQTLTHFNIKSKFPKFMLSFNFTCQIKKKFPFVKNNICEKKITVQYCMKRETFPFYYWLIFSVLPVLCSHVKKKILRREKFAQNKMRKIKMQIVSWSLTINKTFLPKTCGEWDFKAFLNPSRSVHFGAYFKLCSPQIWRSCWAPSSHNFSQELEHAFKSTFTLHFAQLI